MKFLRDRCGNVLPTFAITLVPLIVTTGGVVDYSRAYDQKTAVQDAMDSAALAAGKKIGLVSEDNVKAEANDFFNSNIMGKVDNLPVLKTNIAASTITITTNLTVPTYFLGIIGLNKFDFPLTAKATLAMGTLEVALVLDNSTSMTMPSSKISTLKTAATDLATTLWGLASTSTKPDPVKIAVVPFGASVNVGSSATWVDTAGKGTYSGDSMKGEGAASSINPWTYFSTLKDSSGNAVTWGGCVEERPQPYDVSDDAPSTAANPTDEEKKTLFVPMFAPDEPDNWTCSTSKCAYAGTDSDSRRYNGAPTGASYNNYLPDDGDPTTCAADYSSVTMNKSMPATFTRSSHGLSVGSEIVFSTTGSLYSGVDEGTPYYVASVPSSSTFLVSEDNTGTTVTMTKANPAVFTSNRHGLKAGDAVMLTTSGSLYTGVSTNTVYYVLSSGLSTNSFRLSTSAGGTAVKTSGSQSGTQRFLPLVGTTGSQSGTQYYNKAVNFTCADGDANCGGTNVGKSENTALAGNNSSSAMCKYGTAAHKATIANFSVSGIAAGPNYMCSTAPITPLTTTAGTVSSAITSMKANGYTNITAGLMWGWRVLSSGAPFTEGRAKTDTENQKIIILMTDGENTYMPFLQKDENPGSNSYAGKFVKSAYGAWSYIFKGHLGTTSTDSATVFTNLNARTALACANAKAAGIRIYTVGFEINDQSSSDPAATLAMLQTCASDTNKYFDAQNETALVAAFSAIGEDISLLRISQ
jgi:Flp pilus assembly protein TadG